MPAIYVPNDFAIGLLRWTFTGDPEEMAVTIGLHDVTLGASPQDMADSLYDAAVAVGSIIEAPAAFLAGWTFVGTEVRYMTAAGFLTAEHVEPVAGLASTSPLPNNCALLVHKTTALGGRRNRGRLFAPLFDIGEGDVDARGFMESAVVTAYQGRYDEFLDQLDVAGLTPELFHYPIEGGDQEPDPTPITGLTVRSQIATQRRRMRP